MKRLFVVLLICAGTMQAFAQHKVTPRPASHSSSSFVASPFDPSLQALKPFYVGHDARAVYTALSAKESTLAKSDFETSASYAERLRALSGTALVHGMTLNDLYAFSVKPETSYDADTQIMKVKIGNAKFDGQLITQWSESTVEGGSYIGSNNFGVKRRISIFHTTHYNIQTDQPSWLLAEMTHQNFSVNGLPLTEDGPTARLLSNDLGVLLIGSLTTPYATAETGGNEPTIDNPVDNTTVDRTLHVKLSAVWLYNLGTGEVIKRYEKAASEHDWTNGIPANQISESVGHMEARPPTRPAVNISGGVAAGMLLQKTLLVYPSIAKAAGVTGTVVLQITISKTGLVENPRAISGPAMLQQAALDTVKNWRYRPYLFNNEPIKVETTVNVIFALGG